MIKTGILKDGDPIELIDGMLVYKDRSARGEDPMGIGVLHNLMIKLLSELDPLLRPLGCHLQAQGPITLPPHHEPEPDGAIVRGLPRDYTKRVPNAEDVFCVMEVADSSLTHDRTTKLRLYAQAGIPQYVLVNLVDLQLEVYEQPVAGEGRYAQSIVLKAGQALPLLVGAGKRLEIPAENVLP
jgi:Uma2 family endonuclease